MDPVRVHVAVLSIADPSATAEVAMENVVADRLTEAGHEITGFAAVRDAEIAIRSQLVGWIEDPEIDLVIVVGESEAAARALAPLTEQPLPGFADLLRMLAYQEIGASAMLGNAEAARCGSTFVFVLPASEHAVRAAMDKLLLPQLDPRTGPRNLVAAMPRLSDQDVTKVDLQIDVTSVDAIPVPVAPVTDRTASGPGVIPRLPAVPAPRARPRTGVNVNVKKLEDPTKPIELERLERHVALSKPEDETRPLDLHTGDVTKPMDLGRPPAPPVESAPDPTQPDAVRAAPAPLPRIVAPRASRPPASREEKTVPAARVPASREEKTVPAARVPASREEKTVPAARVPASREEKTVPAARVPDAPRVEPSDDEAVVLLERRRAPTPPPARVTPPPPPAEPARPAEIAKPAAADPPRPPTPRTRPPTPPPPARVRPPTPPPITSVKAPTAAPITTGKAPTPAAIPTVNAPPAAISTGKAPTPAAISTESAPTAAEVAPVKASTPAPIEPARVRTPAPIDPVLAPPPAPTTPARVRPPTPAPIAPAAIDLPLPRDAEPELPHGAFVYPPTLRRSKAPIVFGVLLLAGLAAGAVFYLKSRSSSSSREPATIAQGSAAPDAAVAELADAAIAAIAAIDAMPVADEIEPEIEPEIVTMIEPPVRRPARPRAAPPRRPRPERPRPEQPRVASAETPRPDPPRPDPAPAPAPEDPECGEVACVMENYARPCCARYKPTGENFQPRVGSPATLDRSKIRAGVEKMRARVIACGERFGVKGTVTLAITVAPAGTVQALSVQTTPDPGLGDCVAGVLRKARFAKTDAGGSFTYPFVF